MCKRYITPSYIFLFAQMLESHRTFMNLFIVYMKKDFKKVYSPKEPKIF